MQQNNTIFVTSQPSESDFRESKVTKITKDNLIEMSIYYSVRHCIEATWLNDRDQFLYPNNGWETDAEFQNDCLAYTLFNNNIQSKYGTNQWIPFTEREVNARDKFESGFMTDYISGKIDLTTKSEEQLALELKDSPVVKEVPVRREFSPEAKALFDAGRELWRYYHAKPDCNVNASFYDIREYFQLRKEDGRMNNTSEDERYTELLLELRSKAGMLARKIEPKVFEYGFLKN